MKTRYESAGFMIDCDLFCITSNGISHSVRAKTFSLLRAFLEQPREILSKEYLLKTIWDDVAVDEQVIFQSVRELRLLFNNANIIQTHPRKGYAWMCDVEKTDIPPGALNQTPNPAPDKTIFSTYIAARNAVFKYKWQCLLLSAATLLLVALSTYLLPANNKLWPGGNLATTEPVALDGSIIVLPMQSNIQSLDHSWVYLGAMDQLIALLSSGEHSVRPTEIVLELMHQAQLPQAFDSDDTENMFKVTNAGLIVETRLSGNIEEYHLLYKLHFAHYVRQGAVFGKTVPSVIAQVADIIGQYTGQQINHTRTDNESDFRNELMARAFSLFDQGDYRSAEQLFASVFTLEPHNLIAARKLAEIRVYNNNFALAKHTLEQALVIAEQQKPLELARMYYWLAIIDLRQGQQESALALLTQADELAKTQKDWLYRAYIAEASGIIYSHLQNYASSIQAFNEALHHYGSEHCPIGRSRNQLHLAEILLKQGKTQEAQAHFQAASDLFKTYQLSSVAPYYKAVATQLNMGE